MLAPAVISQSADRHGHPQERGKQVATSTAPCVVERFKPVALNLGHANSTSDLFQCVDNGQSSEPGGTVLDSNPMQRACRLIGVQLRLAE